jgi:hypothetical protein
MIGELGFFNFLIKFRYMISTHTTTHRRMKCFVKWIAPDPDKEPDMIEQAKVVKAKVKEEAEKDGLIVADTPWSGSYAKKTGLRRHYRGNSAVDGQDIDLPFIVESLDKDGKKVDNLLDRFEKYIKNAYPKRDASDFKRTKKSIQFRFSNELYFDIVPMFKTNNAEEQKLISTEGDVIVTSIQKHTRFITNRTTQSSEVQGVVEFNQCVRLMKWWREFQANGSDAYYLKAHEDIDKDKRPSSMLIELLCAKAFDELGVFKTHVETLSKWNAFLANQVKNKSTITFKDFNSNHKIDSKHLWTVLDPVTADNNIVKSWDKNKIDELASWFSSSRDSWRRIVRLTNDEEDNKCMEELVKLFGTPFKNNSDC